MATTQNLMDRLKGAFGKRDVDPNTNLDEEYLFALNDALVELAGGGRWYWWDTEVLLPLTKDDTRLSIPERVHELLYILDPDDVHLDPVTRKRRLEFSGAFNQINRARDVRSLNSVSVRSYSFGPSEPFNFEATGTISIPNASVTVTGVGTNFTSALINRVLTIAGDNELFWVTAVASTTSLTVDHLRRGTTIAAGTAFIVDPTGTRAVEFDPGIDQTGSHRVGYSRIPLDLTNTVGEVPDLPPKYHSYLFWRARENLLHGIEERISQMQYASSRVAFYQQSMKLHNANKLRELDRRIRARA